MTSLGSPRLMTGRIVVTGHKISVGSWEKEDMGGPA